MLDTSILLFLSDEITDFPLLMEISLSFDVPPNKTATLPNLLLNIKHFQ